jgi:hypothetical protein
MVSRRRRCGHINCSKRAVGAHQSIRNTRGVPGKRDVRVTRKSAGCDFLRGIVVNTCVYAGAGVSFTPAHLRLPGCHLLRSIPKETTKSAGCDLLCRVHRVVQAASTGTARAGCASVEASAHRSLPIGRGALARNFCQEFWAGRERVNPSMVSRVRTYSSG